MSNFDSQDTLATRQELSALARRMTKLEYDLYGEDVVGALPHGLKSDVLQLMHDMYAPDGGLKHTVERHVIYWRDQFKSNRDVMLIGAVLVSVSLINLVIAILVLIKVY